MKYYNLVISKTARPCGKNQKWGTYDIQEKSFGSIKDVKDYLKKQYYYVKTKVNMYIDDKKGNAKKEGTIYCFKSDPVSYDDCKHYEQHWTRVYKINSQPILL